MEVVSRTSVGLWEELEVARTRSSNSHTRATSEVLEVKLIKSEPALELEGSIKITKTEVHTRLKILDHRL